MNMDRGTMMEIYFHQNAVIRGLHKIQNKEFPISFLDSMIAISFIIYFKGIVAQMMLVGFEQKIGV